MFLFFYFSDLNCYKSRCAKNVAVSRTICQKLGGGEVDRTQALILLKIS